MFDRNLSANLELAQDALDILETMPDELRDLFAEDEAYVRRWRRALERCIKTNAELAEVTHG